MSTALEAAGLIMVPSGYDNGVLGSVKPTDGTGDFTFSRGSNISATRVNEDGYIEKGRENLLTYSNDFSQSAWLKLNGASVVGKTATDPFGVANNAWVVTFDGTSNGRIEQTMANMLKTSSLYARTQSGTQDVQIGNKTSGIPTFTLTTEWQRIEAFSSDGGNPRLRCDDAVILEIFGFQSEQSLVATDYIETTTAPVAGGILEDMPRLSGSCPALLLEPQRTNLIRYSEYFDGSYWTKDRVTISNNATTSPEGKLNASKIIEDSQNGIHRIFRTISGTNNVLSFFAKADERQWISVFSSDASYSYFNVGDGTLGTIASGSTATIEDYGNGWYRCSLHNFYSSVAIISMATGNGISAYQGDGTSGLYIYGIQVEEASYPTSYIPTNGTSQTRLSEASAFELSVFDFFSLGNTESGTFFLETKFTKPSSQNVVDVFSQGGSGTNAWLGTGFQIRDTGGSRNCVVQNIDTLVDDYIKIAIRRDNTTFNVFVNGVKSATTATITNPLKWFDHIALYRNNQNVKQMMEFPTALSDDECIALTTIS